MSRGAFECVDAPQGEDCFLPSPPPPAGLQFGIAHDVATAERLRATKTRFVSVASRRPQGPSHEGWRAGESRPFVSAVVPVSAHALSAQVYLASFESGHFGKDTVGTRIDTALAVLG